MTEQELSDWLLSNLLVDVDINRDEDGHVTHVKVLVQVYDPSSQRFVHVMY